MHPHGDEGRFGRCVVGERPSCDCHDDMNRNKSDAVLWFWRLGHFWRTHWPLCAFPPIIITYMHTTANILLHCCLTAVFFLLVRIVLFLFSNICFFCSGLFRLLSWCDVARCSSMFCGVCACSSVFRFFVFPCLPLLSSSVFLLSSLFWDGGGQQYGGIQSTSLSVTWLAGEDSVLLRRFFLSNYSYNNQPLLPLPTIPAERSVQVMTSNSTHTDRSAGLANSFLLLSPFFSVLPFLLWLSPHTPSLPTSHALCLIFCWINSTLQQNHVLFSLLWQTGKERKIPKIGGMMKVYYYKKKGQAVWRSVLFSCLLGAAGLLTHSLLLSPPIHS